MGGLVDEVRTFYATPKNIENALLAKLLLHNNELCEKVHIAI